MPAAVNPASELAEAYEYCLSIRRMAVVIIGAVSTDVNTAEIMWLCGWKLLGDSQCLSCAAACGAEDDCRTAVPYSTT
jgi:hypothetical protein